ncbi:MAG: alpha/beta hydrolase [Acidobacteria bacterium]|nr:alpha/beta hydrolase [Acidobacteriota bacterium]
MVTRSKQGKKYLTAVIGVLLLIFVGFSFQKTAFTVRLLMGLGKAAKQEITAEVQRVEIRKANQDGIRRAVVYSKRNSNSGSAVVLVPGLTALGVEHPRFVAFAQALAELDYIVLTPDIEDFRNFRLRPDALREVSYWYHELKVFGDGRIKEAGIIGISVAGTIGLAAAALPEIRDEISFVVAIGAYDNLDRCNRYWFTAKNSLQRHGDYPVLRYGKWISMLTAIDLLAQPQDRAIMTHVLRELLLKGKKPSLPSGLSPEAQRWYYLATGENSSDPELVTQIHDHLASSFKLLSPGEHLQHVRCPVYLVHGTTDELIPSGETMELQARLTSAETRVLLTPFLTHTHPRLWEFKGSRKWLGYLETARFLYAFAQHRPVKARA